MPGDQLISRRRFGTGFAAVFAARSVRAAEPAVTPTIAFTGGQWFDGSGLSPAQFYAVNGALTRRRPARVDHSVSLSGKFVVPPFGEAHNHNVETVGPNIDALLQRSLRDGVFYVKNPSNIHSTRASLAGKINTAMGVDAIFANGGITASGGHPFELAERNFKRTGSPVWKEGDFYHTVYTD